MKEGVSIGNSLEEGKDIMLMANHGEGKFYYITFESFLNLTACYQSQVHRAAVTWIPKVRWTFHEIAKMFPGGARTHDRAATLSKLQPNLGIQVTAARCM